MSNFQAINANTIQLGETSGICNVQPAPNRDRIKSQMDLVDSNGANVIDFNQSTNTIDFNGKTVANFTGGGGGGGGDVFLANTQTFTGVNTFNGNTVLTTADTGNLSTTGTITASSTIVGNGGLSINSGTSAVQALTTNNIVTTGTITASAEIQGSSLAAAGGNINCPGGTINGLSLQSTGGQVLLKTGNARIEDDVNNDLRIQANTNVDTIVFRLGATGADNLQLSYDSVTNKSVLRLYDYSASQYYNVGGSPDDLAGLIAALQNTSLVFNPTTTLSCQGGLTVLGSTTLSGTAINIGTGGNVATITCMNDALDALNINSGVVTLNSTATLAKTGTTSGATDIFTSVDTILNRSVASFAPTKINVVNNGTGSGTDIELDITSPTSSISIASSVIYEQYGVNGSGTAIYKVSLRGRIGFGGAVGGVGDPNINLFTLPVGIRPFVEQNYISAAHIDEKTCRIDVTTGGVVSLVAAATTPGSLFVNLGTIDFWAGI